MFRGNENIILYAIPFFVMALIIELLIAKHQNKLDEWFDFKDTISSITMGIGNVIIKLFTKFLHFGVYLFIYTHFRIWDLGYHYWIWVIAFFAEDFSYYIFHYTGHNVRIFWASHVNHHSSQKYNLSTAVRQEWSGIIYDYIFWLWMAIIGFPPIMVVTLQSTNLLYQFWIHTESIKKLPSWFEFIFNTPSHHRVHHSSDIKYLDKNFAGTLIIWDRLFGTFMKEQERPNYGLTTNLNTYNPVKIAFHEWSAIFKDLIKYPKYSIQYLFCPPGWSHDGSRKTSKQLQSANKIKEQQKNIKEEVLNTMVSTSK